MADEEYGQRLKDTGRNDTCPCGSGKKYKKCHLQADEELRSAAMAKTAEEARKKADEEEKEEEGKKDEKSHPPSAKGHKDTSPKPRAKPGSVARQVSTPRKAGQS